MNCNTNDIIIDENSVAYKKLMSDIGEIRNSRAIYNDIYNTISKLLEIQPSDVPNRVKNKYLNVDDLESLLDDDKFVFKGFYEMADYLQDKYNIKYVKHDNYRYGSNLEAGKFSVMFYNPISSVSPCFSFDNLDTDVFMDVYNDMYNYCNRFVFGEYRIKNKSNKVVSLLGSIGNIRYREFRMLGISDPEGDKIIDDYFKSAFKNISEMSDQKVKVLEELYSEMKNYEIHDIYKEDYDGSIAD